MKKLFTILSALFVLAGSLANSALLSIGSGIIVSAAISPEIGAYTAVALFVASLFMPSASGNYAYITFTQGICEKVQTSLVEIFGNNAPNLKRTQVGYLQALTSPQNTAGMTILPIDPGTGKKKQVRVKYSQRGTESDITTSKPASCATELEKEPFEETVDISNYIGTKGLKFSESEMRKLCGPDSAWMAEVINNEMDALAVKLNKYLITNQSSNFGAFNPNVVGAKTVNLLYGAQNAANYIGEATIMEDIEALDSSAKPLVIGSGKLGLYSRMTGIGCCNTLGQDISQAGNMDFFRDRFVGNILGNADDFIALLPGHVQLLTWNEYVGSYAKENQTFSHGTITDPFTGMVYDMKWHYNDCDDYYFVQLGVNWDQYFMPSNAFSAYDELVGMNGSLHYRAAVTGA